MGKVYYTRQMATGLYAVHGLITAYVAPDQVLFHVCSACVAMITQTRLATVPFTSMILMMTSTMALNMVMAHMLKTLSTMNSPTE